MTRTPYRWPALAVVLTLVAAGTAWVVWPDSQGQAADKPKPCKASKLSGPPGDADFSANEISQSGEYVIGSTRKGDAIRWRDGKAEIIEDIDAASVVNSDGVMASGGSTKDPAWRYDDGDVEELPAPVDGDVDVADISEAGDVIATVRDTDVESQVANGDPVQSRGFPMLWPAGSNEPVELAVDDGSRGYAEAIAKNGRVLGYQVENGTDDLVPWMWEADGSGEQLPRVSEANDTHATPVDTAGDWVISRNAPNVYRWKLSDPEKSQKVRADGQSQVGIDDRGGAYGLVAFGVPARQFGGEPLPLKRLSDKDDADVNWANSVTAVNRDGSAILGSSAHADGEAIPVVWNCD